MIRGTTRLWAARTLIALVLVMNVQCAAAFLVAPDRYAPGFELSGTVGRVVVQSMGILFLMWNIPYAVAAVNPLRFRTALFEAIVMQSIGLLGEILLLVSLPHGHEALSGTAVRFIIFDSAGLIALLIAGWAAQPSKILAKSPLPESLES